MSALLSPSEARAHCEILAELERAFRTYTDVRLDAVHRPLLSFFPRCQSCSRVLMFGAWRFGSRIVACRCGVSYFEARL